MSGSNNEKYREFIMNKVRAIVDPANAMAEPNSMYPGLFRTYRAVRDFVNPILKSMGVSINKNNMLTDKQFAIACSLVERYADVAVYEYFKHTNWNTGWQTVFEFDENGSTIDCGKAVYDLKSSAKKAAFPVVA